MSFFPDFGNIMISAGAFVMALMIIVTVHEFGHYIIGRWCGIKAEVFSIGFGPVLWQRRDGRDTLWQIAALPLGGYVRFAGDSDAASVGRPDPAQAGRHTMAGAPLWARSLTVAAGPMFNFILAGMIFVLVLLAQGQASEQTRIGRNLALPPQFAQELREGDHILRVDGRPAEDLREFMALIPELPIAYELSYLVDRGGDILTVKGPYPRPPIASSISPRSAAYSAGLRPGDVITHVNARPIVAFSQLQDAVSAGQGDAMALTIWRNGESREITLIPRSTDMPAAGGGFEQRYLIGITTSMVFEPVTEAISPWRAIRVAASQVWFIISSTLSGMLSMITGAISSCNLSSVIGIAETSGAMASQGANQFITFIGFLSVAIGLMNLFPIPVLDGGHLVFFAYEAITGKPPGDNAMRLLIAIGLSLIATLMGFALLNDLWLCR